MNARRIVALTPHEALVRGRQAVGRRLDRWRDERAGRARWRAMRAPEAPAPFFAGATEAAMAALLGEDERRRIVADARALGEGRFDLLGYRDLSFGDPIDWHRDPVHDRRAPFMHASRLDPLDGDAVGDHKIVWELSRHQWLVRLAQAYRLTGDTSHARVALAAIRAWMCDNPPGMGLNWASSLEAALRLISWTWTWSLLRDAAPLTREVRDVLAGAIVAHATRVERYLSHYFSPNTHLTGEALGLFYAGVTLPALPGARRWRRRGASILSAELSRQVLADGVHFEQSTCYQRYTIEIYLHFLLLAARAGIAVARDVGARVQTMLDALLVLRWPDGTVPAIGDADGGVLLPLARRSPGDVRGIFSTGAALFGRADYAWAAGGVAPETAWLLGRAGVERVRSLTPAPPAAPVSRVLPHGGYVVMRSGWNADAHALIFDVGPLGCSVSGGHGHADLLAVQCAVFGRPCLVDPGVFAYAPDPAWRRFFRGSGAHGTITVDGESQAVDAGAFRWRDHRVGARLTSWRAEAGLEIADAAHDAYRRLADPVTHRRCVIFVKPGHWIVVDDVIGRAEHQVELRLQFAPLDVRVDPALWTRAAFPDGRGLLVRPFAAVALKSSVGEGALDPIEGWVAPDYGRREPAPSVTYSTVTRLPLRIVTVLIPALDARGAVPAVRMTTAADGVVTALAVDGGDLVALPEVT
jgi:uncharacterized heparinase superfamily protein